MRDRINRLANLLKTAPPKKLLTIAGLLVIAAAIPFTVAVQQIQQNLEQEAAEPGWTSSTGIWCYQEKLATENDVKNHQKDLNWCPTSMCLVSPRGDYVSGGVSCSQDSSHPERITLNGKPCFYGYRNPNSRSCGGTGGTSPSPTNTARPSPTATGTSTPPTGGDCTASDCSPACTGGATCAGTKPNCSCTGGDGDTCTNSTLSQTCETGAECPTGKTTQGTNGQCVSGKVCCKPVSTGGIEPICTYPSHPDFAGGCIMTGEFSWNGKMTNAGNYNGSVYWQNVAEVLLNNTCKSPINSGGSSDGSPEFNLPGNLYAGTVIAEQISTTQIPKLQYTGQRTAEFLQNHARDNLEFTVNVLKGHCGTGAYAGSKTDFQNAVKMAEDAWNSRIGSGRSAATPTCANSVNPTGVPRVTKYEGIIGNCPTVQSIGSLCSFEGSKCAGQTVENCSGGKYVAHACSGSQQCVIGSGCTSTCIGAGGTCKSSCASGENQSNLLCQGSGVCCGATPPGGGAQPTPPGGGGGGGSATCRGRCDAECTTAESEAPSFTCEESAEVCCVPKGSDGGGGDDNNGGVCTPAKWLQCAGELKICSNGQCVRPGDGDGDGEDPSPSPSSLPGGDTKLAFDIGLDGIGSLGDKRNPQAGGNPNPKRTQRPFTIEIFDSNNNLVDTRNDTFSYSPDKRFHTVLPVPLKQGISTGNYIVKVKTPGYLRKLVGGITNIIAGQTKVMPQVNLTAGDIVENNKIDIADYNVLISCSVFSEDQGACESGDNFEEISDLNDDGQVDQDDYTLLLREWEVQDGD